MGKRVFAWAFRRSADREVRYNILLSFLYDITLEKSFRRGVFKLGGCLGFCVRVVVCFSAPCSWREAIAV